MASIINASTTSTSGLVQTADASGVLQLQSNGVTGLTVGPGGLLTAANGMVFSSMTLGAATTGELEYDGGELYFTPLGTQRGLIPNLQYYRLNSTVAGTNATGAQNTLGVGCVLSSNTIYAFELYYCITRSAGTTSHTVSNLFGGTATLNNIGYSLMYTQSSTTGAVNGGAGTSTSYGMYIAQASATVFTPATTTAPQAVFPMIRGTVSVATGGTFIPQYSLSAAPGGAYTTQIGSYMLIYPIGAAGSNTSVGTWA